MMRCLNLYVHTRNRTGFSGNTSTRALRKLCNLQILRLEPTSFIEKVYALTTRMFCGPWKPARVTLYLLRD